MNILTASRLFTFVREGTMYEISTACFIYRSIFAVQALRKRCVQGHCTAYHFRIPLLDHSYFPRLCSMDISDTIFSVWLKLQFFLILGCLDGGLRSASGF